jgi:hypothetical protein
MSTPNQKEQTIFAMKVELELSIPEGQPPALKEVRYDLTLPKPGRIQESAYLDADKMPTAAGIKMISNGFIHGLASNIQAADASGLWNKQDHILWVLSELERALEAGAEFVPGKNYFKTPG